MMKIHQIIFWTCMIGLCGCSTVRVSQDYRPETDFSNLKTYRWQPVAHDIQGDAPMDAPLRDEHIQKVVERNLHSLGFRGITAAVPDFFIDFQYSVYRVMESNFQPIEAASGQEYCCRNDRTRKIDENKKGRP